MEIKGAQEKNCKEVMNKNVRGRAEVTNIGVKLNKELPQRERGKVDVETKNLKIGKPPDVDGITAEMMKYGDV